MQRIMIVSDTHRRITNLAEALYREGNIDKLIHLGDFEGEDEVIRGMAGCEVMFVPGNNDFFSDLPREKEFYIGKYKVWLTHGHTYYVSMGNEYLKEEARARSADIVMYGHTHRPVVDIEGGLVAVNPGSLTYPRQEGRRPSFVIMELDRKGEAHFTINYL